MAMIAGTFELDQAVRAAAGADPFRRPWWLPSGHLETVWARRLGDMPGYERVLADTPDHDVVAIDSLPGEPGKPALVLFHGLEGCSRSHTIRQIAAYFHGIGWSVMVPHFRTCGVMNRLPRAYHAGDIDDAGWMLSYAASAFPKRSALFALGVSLGGNVLARWLGNNPGQGIVDAAITVCAPFDLTVCSERIDRWFNRLTYGRYFLGRLKGKIEQKIAQYPFLAPRAKLDSLRTLRQFDDLITAPMHGFDDSSDYYQRASAMPVLGEIATPLLVVQSDNDSLVPPHDLPGNPHLIECTTRGGGHAGFVSSPYPGTATWLSGIVRTFLGSG